MAKRNIRTRAAAYTVGLHIFVGLVAVLLYMERGIVEQDLMTLVATATPVTATFIPSAWEHMTSLSQPYEESNAPASVTVGVFLAPAVFAVLTSLALFARAYHWGLNSSEVFQKVIIAIQSGIGAYAGKFLTGLLGEPSRRETASARNGTSDAEPSRAE